MNELKFIKTRDVKSPERGTPLSAGIDFYVPNDFHEVYLSRGVDVLIPSGIRVKVPHGYMLIAHDKSGIVSSSAAKEHAGMPVKMPNAPCLKIGAKVVDEDYQGEVHIHLINVGLTGVWIKPGMKIAQFILVPVSYAQPVEVTTLDELYPEATERGEGGFGSTNNK